MEKISSRTSKKKPNRIKTFFKDYVSDFGFRQIATLLFLAGAVVLLIGLIVSNQPTILVGFWVYLVASSLGIIGCARNMLQLNKRSPSFKRAVFNLCVLILLFGISLAAVIAVPIHGIFVR
jgi:hypothetical protein